MGAGTLGEGLCEGPRGLGHQVRVHSRGCLTRAETTERRVLSGKWNHRDVTTVKDAAWS